ncbi:putative acetyltransferase [Prosthecobacter debontii]|uniref:Putative acetyltransferase n=1 Tax=Prosthecobacter debontii TaxID=48467 RepID=A0A1T4XZ02_9BACT|nr:GNAT family N-acetyltransferase [Prosthecobacter debontii]SKA94291.1 putative acetyltransferase [Prosthecobacter debontii]
MPPGYTLRPATNADCEAVRAVVLSVLAEYGLQADLSTTDADLFDLEGHYAQRGGCFEVVVDPNGKIIASVGLQPQGEGLCELRKMYLLPQHRGRGIGRTLLDHALQRARELGFREIHLETASVLKEATAMYERAGFQPYQPEHCSARCDLAYRLML